MRALGIGAALAAIASLAACIPSIEPPPEREAAYLPGPVRRPPYTAPPPQYRPEMQNNDAQLSTLTSSRPPWEARAVPADARKIEQSIYIVRPGDTLRAIADRTGAGSDAIARANGIETPVMLRTGQRLTIPAGRYHLVRRGETGIAIARAYGIEWSRIVAANALQEPYGLRAGQRVLIPEMSAGRASIAERAAAFTLDVDDILTGGEPALATHEPPMRTSATVARALPSTAAVTAPPRPTSGFLWPVEGRLVKRFGPAPNGERNDGIKIAVPVSTPIKAAADGVVAYVGDGVASLGGLVIVKHGGGWTTVYGYASKLIVQRGQSVRRGQTIALSGETGSADRPEVHFELRKGRAPVDPVGQLNKL